MCVVQRSCRRTAQDRTGQDRQRDRDSVAQEEYDYLGRCRCGRCVVEVQTQVKVTGGARPSSACAWLSAAASPSASIYLITVQVWVALPSQHNCNERPPSAQVCLLPTLQPLYSVRHRLATALGTQTQAQASATAPGGVVLSRRRHGPAPSLAGVERALHVHNSINHLSSISPANSLPVQHHRTTRTTPERVIAPPPVRRWSHPRSEAGALVGRADLVRKATRDAPKMAEIRRKLVIVGDGACGKTCLLM